VALLNVKDLEESLPVEIFMRVHRSYIISLDQIKFVEGNPIYLDGNTFVPWVKLLKITYGVLWIVM
jgi:hypothetical protein